jgi:hypothetical protein
MACCAETETEKCACVACWRQAHELVCPHQQASSFSPASAGDNSVVVTWSGMREAEVRWHTLGIHAIHTRWQFTLHN